MALGLGGGKPTFRTEHCQGCASLLGSRQSEIGNRQLTIGNGHSVIGNLRGIDVYYLDPKIGV